MTVASLWTALEGCGTPVGLDDFTLRSGDNSTPTVLAVDLSIWICEAISSTALSSFHSDPALYLVYQRTIKLLRLRLGLIFVVEGKRRVRCASSSSSSESHELRQRRSGSQFWTASDRCASLLRLLGVPVVQAEAEGEALCALLNAKGLCDGVVSNDGDCFLFGAKTVYTKFSVENLENRQVLRYDANKLSANVDPCYFTKDSNSSRNETIALSREDLVAFALLTGSDLVGSGVPNVGRKKAIHFIHACKKLKHRPDDRTCLEELLTWGDDISNSNTMNRDLCLQCDDDGPGTIGERCCSVCLHPGDKLHHKKYGCVKCGTEPGEGCVVVTAKEKFVRSVREKTLGMPSFANRSIVNEYFSPNSNVAPTDIISQQAGQYASPDARALFEAPLILKGHTLTSSKEYVRETLPQLLARLELLSDQRNKYVTKGRKYKPLPVRIEKELVKQFEQCYEIIWSINVGNEDTFEFSTTEPQSLLQNSKYSNICKAFHQADRRKRQELDRHKSFIGQKPNTHKRRPLNSKQREKNFHKSFRSKQGLRRERNFASGTAIQKPLKVPEHSNDVSMLMGYMPASDPQTKMHDASVNESHRFRGLEASNREYDNEGSDDEINFDDKSVNEGHRFEFSAASNTNKDWDIESNNSSRLLVHSGVISSKSFSRKTYSYKNYDEWETTPGFQGTHNSSYFKWKRQRERRMHGLENWRNMDGFSEKGSPFECNFDSRPCTFAEPFVQAILSQSSTYILSPCNRERLFVDLGMPIEVTPIISRRFR